MEAASSLRVAAVPMVGVRTVPDNCAYVIDKIADINPQRTEAPATMERYSTDKPWKDMLRCYQDNGLVTWMQ